jgi:hypothetical protein
LLAELPRAGADDTPADRPRAAPLRYLPLVDLFHVHSLRALDLLDLYHSFSSPMEEYSQRLLEPPSLLLPQLQSFSYCYPNPNEGDYGYPDYE